MSQYSLAVSLNTEFLHFFLDSGEKVVFKCDNLDTLDILRLYNKHISSLAPKEEPVETGRPKKKKKLRVKIRIPRSRR